MHMIASRLGWKLDRTEDMIAPVITKRTIISKTMTIKPGAVAGVQQIGRAFIGKKEKITLVFRASVGESHPEDTVEVFGEPHLISTVQGGIHGDVATCAIALNAIPVLLNAEPGLKTMIDLPPLAFSLL
jgi:4-hydroxy-tetrahydrodipicolinate reductase